MSTCQTSRRSCARRARSGAGSSWPSNVGGRGAGTAGGSPLWGLEQAHMEDIMQAGALRELQAVRNLADALQHLERPGVARTKPSLGLGLE
jgi:hypothetical protein